MTRGSGARRREFRRSRSPWGRPLFGLLGRVGRRGAVARDIEVGPLDLARLVGLEYIALLHVVEVLEDDPALEALLHLTNVVLETPQAGDPGVVDDGTFPDDTDTGVSADDAARDVAAGDDAEPRGAEERPYLGLARHFLHMLRREHPDEGLLDVLRQLVDHPVGADVDALTFGDGAGLGVRPHVEADHDRVRGRRQHDVALGDSTDTGVDDGHPDLGVLDLRELALDRLE